MKCSDCGMPIKESDGMIVTLTGRDVLRTINWCTWCSRRILTVAIFRRVREKAITDGWVQPPLPSA